MKDVEEVINSKKLTFTDKKSWKFCLEHKKQNQMPWEQERTN